MLIYIIVVAKCSFDIILLMSTQHKITYSWRLMPDLQRSLYCSTRSLCCQMCGTCKDTSLTDYNAKIVIV